MQIGAVRQTNCPTYVTLLGRFLGYLTSNHMTMNLTSPKCSKDQSAFASNGVKIPHLLSSFIVFLDSMHMFQQWRCFIFFLVVLIQESANLEGNTTFLGKSEDNTFADTFPDPYCKLSLKETSNFVKSFPMVNNITKGGRLLEISARRRREGVSMITQRRMESPSTLVDLFSVSVSVIIWEKTFLQSGMKQRNGWWAALAMTLLLKP